VVLDYKHARAKSPGADAYLLQLQSYALAVAQLCEIPPGEPIRTQLVFLRDRSEPRTFLVTATMREQLREQVARIVGMLAQCRGRSQPYPAQPEDECMRLGCGFMGRCHPVA